jgi:hypothetical protein
MLPLSAALASREVLHAQTQNIIMAYNYFYKDNMDNTVMFFVGSGDAEQTFIVNRDLAMISSPVFRSAFTGPWIESHAEAMALEDVDPEVFGFIIHWTHNGGYVENRPTSTASEQLVTYGRLWILGDRLGITTSRTSSGQSSDVAFATHR